MEYSAGNVSNLFWFVETKETVRLLSNLSMDEIAGKVASENLFQQKDMKRAKRQFNVIRKRLESLPDELAAMIATADIRTSKLIVFIGCMATDRLLFELIYEVYRDKLHMGGTHISDADLNIFFKNKQDQSEKVAGMSDNSIKKLKQTYCKYMFEAGLLGGKIAEKNVVKPYIEPVLKDALKKNAMDKYLAALSGLLM